MDFQQYKQGAIALAGLAVLILIMNQFGTPEEQTTDPILQVKSSTDIPVDATPACVAKGGDDAPPVFASAPDPYGIATRQVFDRLVEFDRRSGKIVPGLATRWEVSDNKLNYKFFLRKHVNFHKVEGFTPSRAFNANDVLFSFGRLMNTTNPLHDANSVWAKDFRTVAMNELISDISRRDTHVVEFQLSVPYPKFLSNLTMSFAAIQSQEYGDAMVDNNTPERFFTVPVGTGSMSVAKRDGQTVFYAANPTYWGNFLPKTVSEGEVKKQMPEPEIIGVD